MPERTKLFSKCFSVYLLDCLFFAQNQRTADHHKDRNRPFRAVIVNVKDLPCIRADSSHVPALRAYMLDNHKKAAAILNRSRCHCLSAGSLIVYFAACPISNLLSFDAVPPIIIFPISIILYLFYNSSPSISCTACRSRLRMWWRVLCSA